MVSFFFRVVLLKEEELLPELPEEVSSDVIRNPPPLPLPEVLFLSESFPSRGFCPIVFPRFEEEVLSPSDVVVSVVS